MTAQLPAADADATRNHHWLSPVWSTRTVRHANIYGRYQAVRTLVDFLAAACFVAGSALFLNSGLGTAATWLFLAGSVCFAVKPTIDLVRAFHLRRL